MAKSKSDNAVGVLTVEQMAVLLGETSDELRQLSRRGRIPKVTNDQLPQVKTIRAYCRHLRDDVVSTTEAGRRLGITGQAIRNLIADGYIQRTAGGVKSDDAFNGYIRFLKDSDRRTTKSAAESRVRDARAREIELRTAREEGELIPTEEALAYVQAVVGALISRMNGLPAQITRDLDERRRIEAMLDGVRAEVAAICAEHGPHYRALPDAGGANAEDDAD